MGSAARVTQNHLSKPEDLMLQPLSGNQRPDLLTSLISMSLVPRLPQKLIASLQILFECPTPAIVFGNATKPSRFAHFWQGAESLVPATRNDIWTSKVSEPRVLLTFWLRNVLRATTACSFSTSQLPKVVRTCCVLYILTSTCASRHKGVHFFDISTSKSGPDLVCFVHFDFEMCFAPQRRALFRHLNYSQLQKVLRTWGVFSFITCKCASRHNGVQFSSLIWPAGSAPAALASRSDKSLEKHSVSRLSYLFAHLDLLSSATFSFVIFFLPLF